MQASGASLSRRPAIGTDEVPRVGPDESLDRSRMARVVEC